MRGVSRNLNGPYPRGVVNPYTAHVHPYPTRFHGGIYTRPVFDLPYVRSPHAVFKPDDFYSYYGVKGVGGLGSFSSGSSLGNGSIGGNTLGLGATGTPIYWGGYNTKTVTLQGAVNKVLNSQGYKEIAVDGKLGPKTCAAFSLVHVKFPLDLKSQVSEEIMQEAAAVCNQVSNSNAAVKNEIYAYVQELERTRNVTPAKELVPQTEVVPADSKPAIVVPPKESQLPEGTAKPVVVEIEDNGELEEPQPIEFQELMIDAAPPKKTYGSMGVLLGLVVVGGAAYYFMNKKG